SGIMLRRNPTKIELKLEDIQDFSNKLKENLDSRKTSGNKLSESSTSIEIPIKSRQEIKWTALRHYHIIWFYTPGCGSHFFFYL
ncbi:hypothetical protein Avbf_11666, partial [Armadillidium vulgare]